jgi:hypothetical protein
VLNWLSGRHRRNERTIRDTLFGDMSLADWTNGSGAGEPWTSFESAGRLVTSGRSEEALAVLHAITRMPDLESRHYLEAWTALRGLGAMPPAGIAKQVLGVVVEVGLQDGVDLVAAYRDLSARYYNYSGAGVVWERPDESLDLAVTSLLAVGQKVADAIGPWDGPRPPAPTNGLVRINMLTPSGLLFGQAEFGALAADPLGGQVVAKAMTLMQALIGKASRGQRDARQ